MILTKEYMRAYGACPEGYELAIKSGHIGKSIDEAIAYCRSIGENGFADDLEATKKTETYVRFNAQEITRMEKYMVFNPLTGQHIAYPNLGAAKRGAQEVAKAVLEHYQISVVQAISNEKGDEAWTPIDVKGWLQVVPSSNS